MKNPYYLKEKEVLIIGMGKSGIASAKLLAKIGSIVTIYDEKPPSQNNQTINRLLEQGVKIIHGEPKLKILQNKEVVIKNPGVPYSNPLVKEAIALGVDVITEIELAFRLNTSIIVGVTGTNGKTSTTTWIGDVLNTANITNKIIGNIGIPFSDIVLDANPSDILVIELSSFQLKGIKYFRPQISCLLNINNAHLDYHRNSEDYINSKKNIFVNQGPLDIVVYNFDDPVLRNLVKQTNAKLLPFSIEKELDYGVFIKTSIAGEKQIIFKSNCGVETVIKDNLNIGVPGSHYLSNALAVVAVTKLLGVSNNYISKVLEEFKGLPHRLEFVREINGVSYYNDSKSTNIISTKKALEGFKDNSVILIAGGLDRGENFYDLLPSIKNKVKAIISLGQNRNRFIHISKHLNIPYENVTSTDKVISLKNAVDYSLQLTEPGDTVLFSPASASWDMFDSFETRGDILKEVIHNLEI